MELGFRDDLSKLNALANKEITHMINGMCAFPGHHAKLMSVFAVVKDVSYSRLMLK